MSLVGAGGGCDAQQFTVSTHYDDDRDVFVTTGQLKLPVSLKVTRFAAEFGQYRDWALKGLIKKLRVVHSSCS